MSYPKTLYKYRSWDEEWHKKLLTENQLYFAKANQFNDPFDFSTLLEFDQTSLTIEKVRSKLKIYLKEVHDLKGEELNIELSKKLKHLSITDFHENTRRLIAIKKRDEIQNRYGIVSLSANPLNILIWSHYSSNHAGFSVGFNTIALFEYIREKHGVGSHILEMHYQSKYPRIDINDSIDKWVKKVFQIKYDAWSYESEWRAISNKLCGKTIRIPSEIFSSIILGSEINDSDKDEIYTIAKKQFKRAKVFQAYKAQTEYKLSLKEI